MNSGRLANRVALVTGAAGGIGRAIAVGLAAEGAAVVLVGRNADTLQTAAETVSALSPSTRYYTVDLTVDESVRSLVPALKRDFGGLDILVHSAGVIATGKLEVASIDDFDRQYAANVRAPYLVTQVLLPMLRATRGQIVFINSSAGVGPRPEAAQFAATQHALKAIADTLREEVNVDRVRVLSIFPGRTATARLAKIAQHEGRAYYPEVLLQPEAIADVVVQALALPDTAEVTNIHIRPAIKSY